MSGMPSRDVRGIVEAPLSRVAPPLFTLWLLWGSTYLGIALVLETMPPILANGLRFLAASIVLVVAVVALQGVRVLRITMSQLRATIVMGVMLLGVSIGTLSLAQRYVPSGIAALIVSTMPLWIVILRFRAGDRPSRLTLAGVAVGVIGLTLMLLPGGTTPVSGSDRDVFLWSLAITVSSFLWALFSWRSTRYDLPSNPLTTTVYELGAAGIVLSVLGLITGERFDVSEFSTASWWGWGFLVFASVVAYVCYVWLLDNAAMSLVATYAYVNPVVAVFLGLWILGEPVSRDVVIGLTIVLGGVVLVVSGERRKPALIEEPF
jgi:drug/metabolite transporter (DMT)-like permease